MSNKGEEKKGIGAFFSHKNDEGVTVYFGGRTSNAWGKTLLFYAIFYGMLSAFWISCFTGMQSYIPAYEKGPELQDIIKQTESIYVQTYPGRLFPQNGDSKTIVAYPKQESSDEAERVAAALKTWLEDSTDHHGTALEDVEAFCGPNFGYDTYQPCFFLRLNRIRNRGLRGSNELPGSCEDGGAGEEDPNWQLGAEYKVNQERECKKSNASFIPVNCYETNAQKTEDENSELDFEVKAFLGNGESVEGFAFVPFLNAERMLAQGDTFGSASAYYRDPVVVVRAKGMPHVAEDAETPRNYGKVSCQLSLSEDTAGDFGIDKDTGDVTGQRVINVVSFQ